MAVLKCKMCGGELTVDSDSTICECEYCGSKQTIPGTDDEKRLKLYERANRLRFECEFDKAAGVYEAIVADYQEEAEAYWGLVLCKYGIEYVDDPGTHKKIPTCHRSSFESVMDDANFELVMENSDTLARGLYREEAKRIEEIRKGILEVSSTEEPYDIFICYKETSEDGQRTIDSVIAQNVYEELTERGYRVFFSRITLEDKLGQEYEPYIFAALNSAKVMLVFGTSYDYFNAVWVKNEWSRFLQLITAGQKKTLIPCYKDLDAYDLPKEFKHLQAQDMGKVGAVQDLIRGIDKITERERNRVVGEVKRGVSVASNADQLIKRGHQALEDREWKKADGYFEEALNLDAESAEAFMGKWLSKIHRDGVDGLVEYYEQKYKEADPESIEAVEEDKEHIDSIVRQYEVKGYLSDTEIKKEYRFNRAYESALSSREKQKKDVLSEINSEKLYLRTKQYARGKLAQDLENAISQITQTMDQRIAGARGEDVASESKKKEEYAEFLFGADEKAKELYEKALKKRDAVYQNYIDSFSQAKEIKEYETLKESFRKLGAYEEAEAYITKCDNEIDRLKKELEEENRRKSEEQERLRLKKAKKRKIILIIAAAMIVVVAISVVVLLKIRTANKYDEAKLFFQNKEYASAKAVFEELGDYSDSKDMAIECQKYLHFQEGVELLNKGECEQALEYFNDTGDIDDVDKYKNLCTLFLEIKNTHCVDLTARMKEISQYSSMVSLDMLSNVCEGLSIFQSLKGSSWKHVDKSKPTNRNGETITFDDGGGVYKYISADKTNGEECILYWCEGKLYLIESIYLSYSKGDLTPPDVFNVFFEDDNRLFWGYYAYERID